MGVLHNRKNNSLMKTGGLFEGPQCHIGQDGGTGYGAFTLAHSLHSRQDPENHFSCLYGGS